MGKIRQFLCTHYFEVDEHGRPLYTVFPKKVIWPVGQGLREAKHDFDAQTCLNCGLRYFDTDGRDTILSSPLETRDWFIGKPL